MRAIITGAGSGIGWATALALSERPDARIVLVDRDAERRAAHIEELSAKGATAIGVGGDLADPETSSTIVATSIQAFGGLDALVSAAGSIAGGAPLADLDFEAFDRAFAVNLRPTLLLAQAARPHLAAAGGAIVAVSSSGARHPAANLGGYSASKAALTMLIRQIALEWGPDGIRANIVSPGPTATGMTPAYADPAIRTARAATLPLRRIAEADQVAQTILFLLGPGAAAITGVDVEVDCGMSLTTMALSGAGLGQSKR